MSAGELLKRALTLFVAIAVLLLIAGQALGQPILLGYVATGSMEPTMDAGDGFVAIPSAVTGSPSEGDVVVFNARELHGGELTTHRVVGETDEGYITKGDANPFTDQDGDEPPVTEGQIVAVAWQVDGDVVTIPALGTAIQGVHGLIESGYNVIAPAVGITAAFEGDNAGSLLIALGVGLLGIGLLLDQFGPHKRDANRSRSRDRVYAFWATVGFIVLVLVLFATAAMVIPSGTYEYGLISTDEPTDDPQVLAPGETGELTRTIENAGYLPIVTVHDTQSRGIEATPDSQTVGLRSDAETTLTLTAPETTGEYTRTIEEHRYLAVLPPSVLVWLHGLHPLLAIAAVNGVIVGVVVVLVLVLYGKTDFRIRSPGHHVPLSTRIQRRLRRWL